MRNLFVWLVVAAALVVVLYPFAGRWEGTVTTYREVGPTVFAIYLAGGVALIALYSGLWRALRTGRMKSLLPGVLMITAVVVASAFFWSELVAIYRKLGFEEFAFAIGAAVLGIPVIMWVLNWGRTRPI